MILAILYNHFVKGRKELKKSQIYLSKDVEIVVCGLFSSVF